MSPEQVHLGPSTVRGVALSFANIVGEMSKGVCSRSQPHPRKDHHSAPMPAAPLALGPTGESALKVAFNSDDLKPVGDIIGRPISGGADSDGRCDGTRIESPRQGDLERSLDRIRRYGIGTDAEYLLLADMPNRDVDALTVNANTEAAFLEGGWFRVHQSDGHERLGAQRARRRQSVRRDGAHARPHGRARAAGKRAPA